jgi:hypothetical protein
MKCVGSKRLISLLLEVPIHSRGGALQKAASFRPAETLVDEFRLGPLRTAFSDSWEQWSQEPIPIGPLRRLLTPPIPFDTIFEFSGLNAAGTEDEIGAVLTSILKHLQHATKLTTPNQLS